MVKNLEILILDDSSSALDFKTDKDLRIKLKEIENMTIFLISQRTSSLTNCDKILVLDDGELVAQGTHEELLKNCKLYQDIHYCQFERGGN
ncbi:MAG: ABC transporter ATP-binding protein [Bacilli bacterium]